MRHLRYTPFLLSLTLLAIVIGIAIVICEQGSRGQSAAPIAAAPTPGIPVSFDELAQGTQSTVTERANYRITSQAQLSQLWRMTDAAGSPPTVDFTENDVIAVFEGQEPTAGYEIAVSKIEDGTERMVTITLTKPGGSCILGELLTTPYQIIEVSKTTLPLAHQDIVSTTSCLD